MAIRKMIGGTLLSVLLLADVGGQSRAGGGVKGRVRVDNSASTPAGVTVIVRQGEQEVTVGAADASTYCMEAPGGGGTFKITQDTGRPESGTC